MGGNQSIATTHVSKVEGEELSDSESGPNKLLKVTYSLFFDYVHRGWTIYDEDLNSKRLSKLIDKLEVASKKIIKQARGGFTSDGTFADYFLPCVVFC